MVKRSTDGYFYFPVGQVSPAEAEKVRYVRFQESDFYLMLIRASLDHRRHKAVIFRPEKKA